MKIKIKKIIITGTHLTPALELIRQLQEDKKNNWQIFYIGRQKNSSVDDTPSIESQIIPKLGIKFFPINCGKLDRRWLPNTIKGLPQSISGIFSAIKLVNKIKPDVVVSFGGYVSVPVIISSFFKKIPSITHEQTLTNSLTTKINSKFVTKIALSFDHKNQIDQLPKNKVVVTGNLLRYQLFHPKISSLTKKIKTISQKIVFITAGNQGSHSINLIIKKISQEMPEYFFIHQTGKNDFSEFKKLEKFQNNYLCFDYINTNDFGFLLKNSNLIISRAGANTCQEIVALNQKSILIPLLVSQQDEQLLNAKWVKSLLLQQTEILLQNQLSSKNLSKIIKKLIIKDNQSNQKNININYRLLNLINEII